MRTSSVALLLSCGESCTIEQLRTFHVIIDQLLKPVNFIFRYFIVRNFKFLSLFHS